MAFNLRPYNKIVEKTLYRDKVTIYRYKDSKDEDGATVPGKDPVAIYTDILCKFSFKNTDNPADGDVANKPMIRVVTLHCSLDYDILEGDYIEGSRTDEESGISQLIKGQCNKPNRMGGHQEILISEQDYN